MSEGNKKKNWDEENIKILKNIFDTKKCPSKETLAAMPTAQLESYRDLSRQLIIEIKEELEGRKMIRRDRPKPIT